MLLTITHLKAPWPVGAKVGDVLEMNVIPAWADGKCRPAPDDAELTLGVPTIESLCAEILEKSEGATLIGDGSGEALHEISLDLAIQPSDTTLLPSAETPKTKGKKP